MNAAILLRLRLCLVVGAGWLAAATSASAQTDNASAAEQHRRIAADRAAAEARYAERQRACSTRFVVTSCVEDAKRERRDTVLRLKQEQNQLDDALRRRRAKERSAEIRNRADADAQRRQQAELRPAREPRVPKPPVPHSPKASDRAHPRPSDSPGRASMSGPAGRTASRDGRVSAEQEARSRATFDAAQRAAQVHRESVERRNLRRAAKRPPAAPLPTPEIPTSPRP
jgi:colicin import membrane protein